MKRRDFIALTSGLPLAAAIPATAQTEEKPAPEKAKAPKKSTPQISPLEPIPGPPCLQAGPMLGHVSESEASVWIRASKPSEWAIEVSETPEFTKPQLVQGDPITDASGCTAQLRLHSLQPATRYHYRVLFGDRIVSNSPAASFTTAPLSGTPGKLRIAFSSCVGRLPEHAAASWGEIAARSDFDLFMMLGDNHYGDTTDLERQRLYYTAHRTNASFRDFTARLPLYGIWDDHDYGPNDSDTTSQGKERSLQAFREFWANPPRAEDQGDPAIYYHFQRGEVGFFMLDVRWHRTPNKTPDGPEKTMLGATQLAWLKRNLKASTARIKILASGSEWQSHGSGDSWSKFGTERDALLAWIEAEKISGVIFISGDRHFAGGYQIRDRWIEMTSGPLGSTSDRTTKTATFPETFTVFAGPKMWIVLDIDTTTPEPTIGYEIRGTTMGILDRRTFTWKEVEGLAKITASAPVAAVRAGKS